MTGNLYLPAKFDGKIPGILNPHGHIGNGRMQEYMQNRSRLRPVWAAAFAYDMVGYGESTQCDIAASKSNDSKPTTASRSSTFLCHSLIIDADRLAVTGESGGGTQSFFLAAIDDRIDLSIPVVQVSAHFFGGCECESAMPIHKTADYETDNVEIAATMRQADARGVRWRRLDRQHSQGGVSPHQADLPLCEAEDEVENAHFADEGHDYGPSKRHAAYRFLAKHFNLDLANIENSAGEIDESFVTVRPRAELEVFPQDRLRPPYALTDAEQVIALLDRHQ